MDSNHTQAELSRQSLKYYRALLNSAFYTPEYYSALAGLLEGDRFFFIGHLEMLWRAEETGDSDMLELFTKHSSQALLAFLQSAEKIEACCAAWTKAEVSLFHELVKKVVTSSNIPLPQRTYLRLLVLKSNALVVPQLPDWKHTSEHLRLKTTTDPTPLWQEVRAIHPYWWSIYTKRQEAVLHHQHTWTVVLRNLKERSTAYIPIDGVHESIPTEVVNFLPSIHAQVLRFAKDLECALGRVVLVKMQPWSQAYRHFDADPWLGGRKRYHYVLQSANSGNMLYSGTETAEVKPGELWYFDNTVMHRAHNLSDQPRYHIIFDGYPLK